MKLKGALTYVALFSLGFLSIGCGPEAETATNETKTLTVWQSDFTADSVEQALDQVEAKTVVLKNQSVKKNLFESLSVDNIAADSGPDVWLIPDDWLEDHRNKLIELPNELVQADSKNKEAPTNLQEYFKANYDSYINDRLLTENGAIAFPGPVKPLVLFVNRQLVSQAYQRWDQANKTASNTERDRVRKLLSSPLTTWSDLTEAVKLITQRSGDTITTAGIALGTADNVPNSTEIFALLAYQQGNNFVDIAKQVALFNGFVAESDNQVRYPGRDALAFMTQFAKPGTDVYSWNNSMPNARQAFLDGKVALLLDFPDFETVIKQQSKRIDYNYNAVPQLLTDTEPVNVVRYYLIAATKGSVDSGRAVTLAQSLSSTNKINVLTRGVSGSYSPFKEQLEKDNNTKKQMGGARFVYKKHHTEFDTIIARMIEDVSVRGQAIDVAVNQAANDITALLQRNEPWPSNRLNEHC